jgi:hypothetical protein
MRDPLPSSVPSDWLTPSFVVACFNGEVPSSSSWLASVERDKRPCEPDLDLRRPNRGRLNRFPGESTPRRNVSATTALKPPERGDIIGPGIILAIECLAAGVTGLSACGGAGPCSWSGCVWRLPCDLDLSGAGGFNESVEGVCASEGSTGDEV